MDRRRRRTVTERDVVAELDRWIALAKDMASRDMCEMLQRARDEIVALREKGATLVEGFAAIRAANAIADKARDEALEEAAQLCQARFKRPLDVEALNCARAIRSLKDKP